jgi:hypothetical protein
VVAKVLKRNDETIAEPSVDEFIGKLLDDELPLDEASRMHEATFGGDLYHATKQDIDEFIPGYDDGLTFLTPNPEMANEWLGKGKYRARLGAEDELESIRKAQYETRQNISDYESMNKLEGDEFNAAYDAAKDAYKRAEPVSVEDAYSAIYPVRSNVQNTFDPRKDYAVIEDFLRKRGDLSTVIKQGKHKEGNWIIYENKDVVEELKRLGYDSMLLKESSLDGAPHETLAVFDPKNIRSKFAKFDPSKKDSANILAGAAGAGVLSGLYEPDALKDDEKMRRALLRN